MFVFAAWLGGFDDVTVRDVSWGVPINIIKHISRPGVSFIGRGYDPKSCRGVALSPTIFHGLLFQDAQQEIAWSHFQARRAMKPDVLRPIYEGCWLPLLSKLLPVMIRDKNDNKYPTLYFGFQSTEIKIPVRRSLFRIL